MGRFEHSIKYLIQARASCGSKTTNKEMGWTHAVDGTLLDPE